MKKLLFVITLLAILFTNTLSAQCKFDITQEKIDGYVILRIKHQDSLKIKAIGWNNGKIEKEIIVKENGTYCAKVQFTNGCGTDGCIDVKSFQADTTCKVEIVKFSDNTGKVKFCVRGGNIKKIQWSSGETSECIYPQKSGEYCVKVVTQNGCETKGCLTYNAPVTDTCSIKIMNIPGLSGINKASLCIVPAGNIKYIEWSTGSKEKCITPEKNGEYCVKVQYSNGCTAKECIKIDNISGGDSCRVGIVRGPGQIPGLNNVLCLVPAQDIKNLEWSNGSKEKCITVEKTGEYCVKVEYKNGCIAKECIKFEMPVTPDSCKVTILKTPSPDSNIPTILCAVTTSPVKLLEWSTGSKERCIKPEKTGEYCVTVVFSNGCKVKECTKVEVNTNTCFAEIVRKKDESNGKTYLCVSSKSALKQTIWSTGDTTSCIIPSKSGEYCVKVLTKEGCETRACIKYEIPNSQDSCKVSIVRAPSPVAANQNLLCVSATGEVKIVEWNNGSKERCITPTKSGEYCVTVVYANGCKAKSCVKIEDNSNSCKLEIVKRSDKDVTYLCVASDKRIKSVKWITGDTTTCIKPQKPGEYCVSILTADGCETKKCIAFNTSSGTNPNICNISVKKEKRGNTIYLCAESGSAKSDSSIIWSNGSKGKCIEIKEKGRYCAQISVNGCEARACITIDSITANGFNENDDNIKALGQEDKTESNKILKISGFGPNPSVDYVFVDIKAEMDHIAKIMLFDLNGNNVWTQNIYLVTGQNTTEIDLSGYRNGVYQLKLMNSTDVESIKIVKAF